MLLNFLIKMKKNQSFLLKMENRAGLRPSPIANANWSAGGRSCTKALAVNPKHCM